MARAGYGSRRDSEALIRAGRVQVDGVTVEEIAARFPKEVRIAVRGEAERVAKAGRLWCYHKPRGLITSHRDERGRATVFDTLPKSLGRVVSVGRLDLNSEGLLLLTNDGSCAGALEKSDLPRRYRICVRGVPSVTQLAQLAEGLVHEGILYAPIIAEVERILGKNSWLSLTLKEGKNREIHRVMQHFGYSVSRLIRTSFGAVELGSLPTGECRELTSEEVSALCVDPAIQVR